MGNSEMHILGYFIIRILEIVQLFGYLFLFIKFLDLHIMCKIKETD